MSIEGSSSVLGRSCAIVVTSKVRIIVSLVFLLVAGVAPVVALFVEHGPRAGWFIHSGPHIFFFACFVAPFAIGAFVAPLIRAGKSCTPAGRVGFLVLALIVAGAACTFDYVIGLPQLFEFDRSVQDDAKYRLIFKDNKTQLDAQAAPTLWEYYEDPRKFTESNPQLKERYKLMMRKLAKDQRRSLAVVIPYYVAMYVQILFAIVYVLVLTLLIWHPAVRSDAVIDQLFTSGIICLPWLPAQQAFLQTKGMLYGAGDATSIILCMGIAMLLVYGILYGLLGEIRKRVALPQITFGALILLITAIPQVTDGAWQVFSRDSHPAWSIMLYAFVMLFFVTRLQVVRVPAEPDPKIPLKDSDVMPLPKPAASSPSVAPSIRAKKRQPRKRR